MTLDEKRKVIEVLLCAARYVDEPGVNRTTSDTAEAVGETRSGDVASAAGSLWVACDDVWHTTADHGTVCLEAAYRLIESSPTLRREWFGAP